MDRNNCALLTLCFVSFHPLFAQVVYSGRSYRTDGRSYQQIMTVDAAKGTSAELSNTARPHRQPVCGRDGRTIFFLSGKPGLSWPNTELWSFDRKTRQEKQLARVPEPKSLDEAAAEKLPTLTRIVGTARDGAPILLMGDGTQSHLAVLRTRLIKLAPACGAAVSPDGTLIACWPCGGGTLRLITAEGKAAGGLGRCSGTWWSADGRLACADSGTLRILNARRRTELKRVKWERGGATPVEWSPDGRTFLFAAPGSRTNSTAPYSDYFVFDLETHTWQALPVGGNGAIWLPDARGIVFSTPRELTRLGNESVWTAQLKLLRLPRLESRELAAGVAHNIEPSPCR